MPNKLMAELTELSVADLVQALEDAKDESIKLRFRNATGSLDSSARLGDLRRQVARIHTVLRQREIAAAEGSK